MAHCHYLNWQRNDFGRLHAKLAISLLSWPTLDKYTMPLLFASYVLPIRIWNIIWSELLGSVALCLSVLAQKMKFSIKNFFSKCDQIRSFLRIWSHLLKKSLMENFIFFSSVPACATTWFWPLPSNLNVVRQILQLDPHWSFLTGSSHKNCFSQTGL